jgi:hypothetical protein
MLFMKNIVCDDPFEELKFMGVNAIKTGLCIFKIISIFILINQQINLAQIIFHMLKK